MNTVVWFEIPVTNIERAEKFYGTVMGTQMVKEEMDGFKMSVFQAENKDAVHGALIQGEGYKPSSEGAVVYLNGGEDLAQPLSRVEGAGGKVLTGKTPIGEHGFCAFFQDTEGNRIGIHSMN